MYQQTKSASGFGEQTEALLLDKAWIEPVKLLFWVVGKITR